MKKRVLIGLAVTLVIIGAGIWYFVLPALNETCNSTGPTMGVVVRVLEGTQPPVPVAGARVSGHSVGYCNGEVQTLGLPQVITNSSGWATLLDGGTGTYYLNVVSGSNDSTSGFDLSVPTQPTSVTYVIFNSSTGNVTTHFCYLNLNCAIERK